MPFEADAPLVAHDMAIAGDTVYDLRLNHVWRRIVGGILIWALEHIRWNGTPAEIEQAESWYAELVNDFYDKTFAGAETVYHGALVSRSTDQTITVQTPVVFDSDAGNGDHDTDGYWNVELASALQVPSGLGGMYFVYAFTQWGSGASHPFVELSRFGSSFLIFQRQFSFDIDYHQLHISAPVELADGDRVRMSVEVGEPSRDLIIGAFPYSARLGMYHIGE